MESICFLKDGEMVHYVLDLDSTSGNMIDYIVLDHSSLWAMDPLFKYTVVLKQVNSVLVCLIMWLTYLFLQ